MPSPTLLNALEAARGFAGATRLERAAVRALFGLPEPARRRLGVAPSTAAPALAADALLLLRLAQIADRSVEELGVERARAQITANAALVRAPHTPAVSVQARSIPADWGELPARLYVPASAPTPSPLLVYFHGGGWVIGSLDTHDELARRLAAEAGARVLSVDYRLAPEHPFPAAIDDAELAFAHVSEHPDRFGAIPGAIAVGGDSAGGNLAAVVALRATAAGVPAPAFQLLFYPACDAPRRHPSCETFADGFLLTAAAIDWYVDRYVPDSRQREDPRFAPLRAPSLAGLAPAYVATGAADPLRDEGEAYARRLREEGVPVVLHRQQLLHGFANTTVCSTSRAAVAAAAGALSQALAAAVA